MAYDAAMLCNAASRMRDIMHGRDTTNVADAVEIVDIVCQILETLGGNLQHRPVSLMQQENMHPAATACSLPTQDIHHMQAMSVDGKSHNTSGDENPGSEIEIHYLVDCFTYWYQSITICPSSQGIERVQVDDYLATTSSVTTALTDYFSGMTSNPTL